MTTQSSTRTLRRQIMFIGQCRKRQECLEGKLIASHPRLSRKSKKRVEKCFGHWERKKQLSFVQVQVRTGKETRPGNFFVLPGTKWQIKTPSF